MPANRSRKSRPQPLPRYAPVGALVLNAYWRIVDEVLAHNEDGTVTVRSIKHPLNAAQWSQPHHEDMFRVRTHSTPLDRKDRILALPVDHNRR
jgi:hypothetical protein